MKSRMLQLSKGNIEYRSPEVTFGAEILTGKLTANKRLVMEVGVLSANNEPMHLFFYSGNPRVKVSQPLSIGRTGKMKMEVSTIGLPSGSRLTGKIDIVYNGGEMSLPYDFTVMALRKDQEPHLFENLAEFAAFARENYRDAAREFGWKEFTDMPFMRDLHLMGLYQTFMSNVLDDSGLAQFLNAAGYPLKSAEDGPLHLESVKEHQVKEESEKGREKRKERELLKLFMDYECAKERGEREAYESITGRFMKLASEFKKDPMVHLMYAWYCLEQGAVSTAKTEIIGFQDRVQKERLEHKDAYCLFLYLVSTVQNDSDRLEMARKLTHKYFMDGNRTALMHELEYFLNPEYRKDHTRSFSFLFQYFNMCPDFTPVLLNAARLFRQNTGDINVLSAFELKTALFGIRRGILSERVLFEILSHDLKDPALLNLYMLVLKTGYNRFGSSELLQAICNVYLQQRKTGPAYFIWYKKAVQNGIEIPGLYEYYLASAPRNHMESIPREVIVHFGQTRETAGIPLDMLYNAVVTEYAQDAEIQSAYHERIEAYALKKLRLEEYTVRLIPVLDTVLKEEYLDDNTAPGMLEAFYLYRVKTTVPEAARVVIHYPQLKQEAGYAVRNGEALVPVFSTEVIYAFEDSRGHRFHDPHMQKSRVFENDALKKKCLNYVNDTLLIHLGEADQIIRQGAMTEQEIFIVTDLIKNRKIDAFYRTRLYETLIDLSGQPVMADIDCCEFLMEADYTAFSPEYQVKFLEMLIDREYYKDAYRRILEYGYEGLSLESIAKLAENLLNEPVAQGDRTMTSMCFRLYEEGQATPGIYGYLAEYFEGGMSDLMSLIRSIRRKKLPLKKLPERAITECFYVDDDTDLDTLFDLYLLENHRDPLVRSAYLMLRSHHSFLNGECLPVLAAEELKKEVLKLPRVAGLALLQHFALQKEELSDYDRSLCEALIKKAVDENIVLGCFRQLEKKVKMPADLEGRAYVEFRSKDVRDAAVFGRVMPAGKYFRRTLSEVYPGVFTKSFVLYKGECIKYYYSIRRADGSIEEIETDDVVSRDTGAVSRGSRYDDIERLEMKAEKQNVRDTAELMRSLILKDAMIDEIFK